MKYNAFISYSHAADGRMAPALQSALERFAKPWYKLRNLNVFRDEASLSVSPHLWSNIQKALDDSEYLIYMASPESANSKWVNKEIKYWLEVKSIDTLLIVLSDGHLNWENDDKISNQGINSLPPTLVGVFNEEPFYVDLRDMRSESDLSIKNPIFKKDVLKLAAQLHGKAPKDLASEEVSAHRKMIWTRNIAALFLVSLMVYSFLSTKSALNSSEENMQLLKVNNINDSIIVKTNSELEKKMLEKKIVDDSLRIKDDSLKSAQEQRRLSDKLANTQTKLKKQAEEFARRAELSEQESRKSRMIAQLHIRNSEAKWSLLDTFRMHGINAADSYRIIKLFEQKERDSGTTIFYTTQDFRIEKYKDSPIYKIKLLNRNSIVISAIDSVRLDLSKD